jgi:TonB family protein
MHELVMSASRWVPNHPPEYVFHYLTHSVLILAVVGVVAWLGDRMLRKVGPQAQHRMWVAALLASVALPLLPAGWLSRFGHVGAGAAGGTATVTYHMVAAAAERWTVSPLLCAVVAAAYLLSVLFCVARLLWRWCGTRAMARRGATLPLEASACGLLESAARRFGVTEPAVRSSDETRGPVVLGLRRPLLLLPQKFFAAESVEDIAAALAHECAHIARRDYAKHLLYEVVAAAVAYHPACWLMRRRIAETRELVCDEMAAGAVGDRPEYAASLLRLATAMAAPAAQVSQAIGVFDANILEERIMRLTMDVPKVSKARKIAMVTVTTCALLGGVATAAALSFDVTPQDNATAAATATEKVYHIGNGVTAPLLTYSVDAKYPQSERSKGKANVVVVCELVVNSKGLPQDVHVVQSAGRTFDNSAMDAIRQYRFSPAMRKGEPVAVSVTIETNMRLY